MRTFQLIRVTDHTGISGTGTVADGCEFPDGTTAVRWRELTPDTDNYFPSVEAVEALHGHGGATIIRWTSE